MSKRLLLVLPFIIISFQLLRLIGGSAQDSRPKTQDSKRAVLIEALNKSKRGLNDIELKGEEYFRHYCVICHGEGGRGNGFNAYNLNPKPKDFAEIIPSMDDQYLYKVISEGTAFVGKSALCPPRGLYLERDVIEAIIAYLRVIRRAETSGER